MECQKVKCKADCNKNCAKSIKHWQKYWTRWRPCLRISPIMALGNCMEICKISKI